MKISAIPTEAWGALAAAAGLLTLLAKKFAPSRKPKPEYITRAEFHKELDGMRDRIGAGYLALAEKLDRHQEKVLTRLDRFESRLDHLHAAVARVDERTRFL